MEKENEVFETITRRRALSTMLNIPPLLLGLASFEDFLRPQEVQKSMEATPLAQPRKLSLDGTTLEQYKHELGLYWKLHYTSSTQSEFGTIQRHIAHLQILTQYAQAGQKDQVIEQLCGYYELFARIASDQGNFSLALQNLAHAVSLCHQLDKPNYELHATLLYRRGIVYYERGLVQHTLNDFTTALIDLEEAHAMLPQIGLQLSGSILLEEGLVRSHLVEKRSMVDTKIALRYLDRSETLVRQAQLENGKGTIKFNEGRFLSAKGEALLVLGRHDEAQEMLDIAELNTPADLTRRLVVIDVQRIKSYIAENNLSAATVVALETAKRALSIGTWLHIDIIKQQYNVLRKSKYGSTQDVDELGRLLVKARGGV